MEVKKGFNPAVWEVQHDQLQEEHNTGMARRRYGEQGYLDNLKGIFFHIPKCGGTTLSKLWSPNDVSNLGHAPWFMVKEQMYKYAPQGPKAWERAIKFAMVRNPWDRAVSWFYGYGVRNEPSIAEDMQSDDYELHRKHFVHWCFNTGAVMMNSSTFRTEGLITKSGYGLQIDYVMKFEDFEFEVTNVSNLLGVERPKVTPQLNPSTLRPRDLDYQFYYETDEFLQGLVAGWGWFEIKHMGYSFR